MGDGVREGNQPENTIVNCNCEAFLDKLLASLTVWMPTNCSASVHATNHAHRCYFRSLKYSTYRLD